MIKKTALVILIFISVFFSGKYFVLAEKEAEDYSYQLEKYRQLYNDFGKARDAYLKYQSLTARDDAVLATKNIILERYVVLKTYFQLLKVRLRNTSAMVGSDTQSSILSQLDTEITWIDNQTQEVNNLSPLDLNDLFIISDRLEVKSASYNLLAYEALSLISIGKVKGLQAESLVITNTIKESIDRVEASQQAQLRNWIAEVENRNYQNQKIVESAENKYANLTKKSRGDLSQQYNDLKADLENVVSGIKAALNYQQQVFSAFPK